MPILTEPAGISNLTVGVKVPIPTFPAFVQLKTGVPRVASKLGLLAKDQTPVVSFCKLPQVPPLDAIKYSAAPTASP